MALLLALMLVAPLQAMAGWPPSDKKSDGAKVAMTYPYSDDYYFAEGCTRPGFETYFCLLNTEDQAASARIHYCRGEGGPINQDVVVPPRSRLTLRANDFLGEGNDDTHDFAARITVTDGLIATVERPMYFRYKGIWDGGSNVMGASWTSDEWYFAEGCTRPGFETWLTLGRVYDNDTDATIIYACADGYTKEVDITVPEYSRVSISLQDPILGIGVENGSRGDVSIFVYSDDDIVAERSMYFSCGGRVGGHCVVGCSDIETPGRLFAEGSCRPGLDPYICVLVPFTDDGGPNLNNGIETTPVEFKFFLGDGTTRTYLRQVPVGIRYTLRVKDVLGEGNGPAYDFSGYALSTEYNPLVAERSMYFNYGGKDGGHCVVGTESLGSDFYFAEGTCRPGFNPYLSVFVPDIGLFMTEAENIVQAELAPVDVYVEYFLGDGSQKGKKYSVPMGTRLTIDPHELIGTGVTPAYDFSTVVYALWNSPWGLQGFPLVVERPMYFNFGGREGGHCEVGAYYYID